MKKHPLSLAVFGILAGISTVSSAHAESASPFPPRLFEVGVFGGVMFPADNHDLKSSSRVQRPLSEAAPEIGLRFALMPSPYFGVEVEGAALPTTTRDGDKVALWTARAHGIGQLPMGRLTPFVLVGGGGLNGNSTVMGRDTDETFHFGAGAKLAIDDFLGVRLDVRDTLADATGRSTGLAHFPELLLGLTFGFDPPKPPPPPPAPAPKDSDADGLDDATDHCPDRAGPAPTGCPVEDADHDGVLDAQDQCPNVAGPQPTGCPPPADQDGDGVPDDGDKCPTQPAKTADGCPDLDADKDGVNLPADKCPDAAETVNGFQDDDGCPDELPVAAKRFNGVMDGIEFDSGRANIREKSLAVLGSAAEVLREYPSLRVRITGHTDDVGNREQNLALSKARADSVKKFLVEKGIAENRIETDGKGPDVPVADNKKPEGRQKNRRIVFEILTH